MNFHKNSQKRIYSPGAIYFITTNTYNRHPFFAEDVFCELLLSDLFTCLEIKKFELLGYKINPDHVHLLIKPGRTFNYSEIIQNIKRTSSLHINQMIEGLFPETCVQTSQYMLHQQEKFTKKYCHSHPFPKFKWQKSFNDHIIRDDRDLQNHLRYIQIQWLKHGLQENRWCFTDSSFQKTLQVDRQIFFL